jgi:hypothetical protein
VAQRGAIASDNSIRLSRTAAAPSRTPVPQQATGADWRAGFDFSAVPVRHYPSLRIQPKLAVGQSDDPLEHEADRLADQVMRMPEPQAKTHNLSNAWRAVQPAPIHAKSAADTGPTSVEAPPIVREVLNSPGQPLDAATRAFFEPRFKQDFGDVRVHTDEQSRWAAHAIGARAFTAGSDIAFMSGAYEPRADRGQRLLAHELAHVVQQGATGGPIRRQALDPGEPLGSPAKQSGLDTNPAAGAAERARITFDQARDFVSQKELSFGPKASPSIAYEHTFRSAKLPPIPLAGGLLVAKPSLSATFGIKFRQENPVTVTLGKLSTTLQSKTECFAVTFSEKLLSAEFSAPVGKTGSKISTSIDFPTLENGITTHFQTEPKSLEVIVQSAKLEASVAFDLAIEIEASDKLKEGLSVGAVVVVSIVLLPEEVLMGLGALLLRLLTWLRNPAIGSRLIAG